MNDENYNNNGNSLMQQNNNISEKKEETYSYNFNSENQNVTNDDSFQFENNEDTNSNDNYLGGYQLNQGKSLVKSLGNKTTVNKYPYGIRGDWSRGVISVLGIAIILGLLFLVITFIVS